MADVETGGGASVGGNVGTAGGDFAGRDFARGDAPRNEVVLNLSADLAQQVFFHLNQMSLRLSFIEHDLLEIKARQRSTTVPISAGTIAWLIVGVVGFAIALVLVGIYLGRLV